MTNDNKENKIIMYQTDDSKVTVDVRFEDETFWLTQKALAELFDTTVANINIHIKNIIDEGELDEGSTIKDSLIVQSEGNRKVSRKTLLYNLDIAIAVGYRVNSKKATQFRIWATQTLKEYIIKGFALNDEMLKNGKPFGKDYFRELLERIRSIRASERRVWQQITDIFAECSINYDKDAQTTHDFYAMVQNKFHYAITGQTAAEIVYSKADRNKENMGLTTWKHAPDGRVLKTDVTIAKNYLSENQIRRLERTVSGYFDYIEDLIERENIFTMEEFSASINEFLAFRKYQVLTNKGNVSKEIAQERAETEYAEFSKTQKITSDFDKAMNKYLKGEK